MSSRVLGGGAKRGRGGGGGQQRLDLGGPPSSSSTTIPASASVLDLQPRFQNQRKYGASGSKGGDSKAEEAAGTEKIKRMGGTSFIDRAALRRRGIADPAELEIEDDADESARPPKGLNLEALGKNEGPEGPGGSVSAGVPDDDDLEQAFQSVATGDGAADNEAEAISTSAAPKSRDDILAALSRRKQQARGQGTTSQTSANSSKSENADEIARARAQGKFKTIGFKSVSSGGGGSADDKDFVIINGKRMRKKRKKEDVQAAGAEGAHDDQTAAVVVVSEPGPSRPAKEGRSAAPMTNIPTGSDITVQNPSRPTASGTSAHDETDHRKPSEPDVAAHPSPSEDAQMDTVGPASVSLGSADGVTTSAPPVETIAKLEDGQPEEEGAKTTIQEAVDDDDDDIFAEADEWKGLDIDSDEEGNEPSSSTRKDTTTSSSSQPVPTATTPPQQTKRDWFGSVSEQTALDKGKGKSEGHEEEDALSRAMREANEAAAKKAQAEAEAVAAAEAAAAGPIEPSKVRLTGLSDSALPSDMSRFLLEREREREAGGGFRKKKKTKEGEEGGGEDDDDDEGVAPRKRKRKRKGKGGGSDDD
ncbi:hypothetical protein A4X13_0g4714 [Tilletia indica]|uniref:RED-like N-terminal domain-containing protein n=1 Tax=Tilletia indica TaxID=43049 RepID=A0A177TM54_9BASI|nr:hypothetical protein A4X13_0g4714 [Tilletia indica]